MSITRRSCTSYQISSAFLWMWTRYVPSPARPSCTTLATRSYLLEGVPSGTGMISRSSMFLTGKLTMVGFFSTKKLFLVKRFMCRHRYCGRRVIRNFLRPRRMSSVTVLPSNLRMMLKMGTCGMIFFSSVSLNSGAGGRSRPSSRKGMRSVTSAAAVAALPLPVPFSVVTSNSPWKHLVMMDCFLILPPVRSACSALSSHDANSTGSDCVSSVKRFFEARMTACMNSCRLTCPLKLRVFQILRRSSPQRDTSRLLQPL
mmetsp:Transcript_13658/g.36939  ORF Transcript_13658/g.36939 Transcript_13658/m.36939 type:complete len:258 (-) Transcript_13658:845-1618(-)